MKDKDRFTNILFWSLVVSFGIGMAGFILIVAGGIYTKLPAHKLGMYTSEYCLVEAKDAVFVGRDCKITGAVNVIDNEIVK